MRITASAPPRDCKRPGGRKPPSQAHCQLEDCDMVEVDDLPRELLLFDIDGGSSVVLAMRCAWSLLWLELEVVPRCSLCEGSSCAFVLFWFGTARSTTVFRGFFCDGLIHQAKRWGNAIKAINATTRSRPAIPRFGSTWSILFASLDEAACV